MHINVSYQVQIFTILLHSYRKVHFFFREQILYPLVFTEKLGQVDVEVSVEAGGSSGQAGAIRLGLSRALRSLVDEETVEKMRIGEFQR